MDLTTLENGCQCPAGHPPCDFCTSMNEEEAEAYFSGGMEALRAVVNGIPKSCTCTINTLMQTGCVCGGR